MKILEAVLTLGLMFLSFIPRVIDGMCTIFAIEKPILICELKDASNIKPDTVKPDTVKPNTITPNYHLGNVRSLLSDVLSLFILETANAATLDDQLNFLYQVFPSSPLEPDTDLLEEILCTAGSGKSILLVDEIKTPKFEDSTRIWFVQAVDVFTSKPWVKMLCHLIKVSDDMANGVQGNLDKKDVRTATAVTDTITSSGQPARVFLTGLKHPAAPVPNVALPFVPTKTVWNRDLQSRRNRRALRSLTS